MAEKTASFSQRLRAGLDRQGMSQTELARRSGISKSSISRYIKGDWEGKQEAVYALAQALDVSEGWLMGYDVPPDRAAETDNVYLGVGAVLRKYRRAAGLTAEQAAAQLGVPAERLEAWEANRETVPPECLARAAELCRIPSQELAIATANDLLPEPGAPSAAGGTFVWFEGTLTGPQMEELRQFARFLQQRDGAVQS